MRFMYTLSLLVPLGCVKLSLAEFVLTMPWVGFASSGNYWQDYEGRVIGENGDTTTYAINCPPASDETACIRFDPDATFIAAPSSYDFIMSDYGYFTSTGCTFTGSPIPTTATCSYSQSYHIRSHTVTHDRTYVLPGTEIREILSATLTVAGTGPFPTGTAATATAATTNKTTGSTTGATVAGTSATSTTVFGNVAGRTVAPMMLVGAVVAGMVV
ncbi:hypothetical protein Aspvir_007944 [Aspergillus viridinutans]|uniref:Uncharacterized protein n=1 Tax=Aspergillus viridinutans TaxID=75553 RepID=A0A9P3F3P2_ASPVI|nr:uncharacterized protein Aspvir_007944 [Aspergillus viridinutans]GIK03869.1 hypothetical protein Aspvir_007944 [Aspergillus viridinutans]